MISRYAKYVKEKHPHERRVHTKRMAGLVTASLALVWLSMFGLSSNNNPSQGSVAVQTAPNVGDYINNGSETQAASAYMAQPDTQSSVEVSTTSLFTPDTAY